MEASDEIYRINLMTEKILTPQYLSLIHYAENMYVSFFFAFCILDILIHVFFMLDAINHIINIKRTASIKMSDAII